MDHCWGGDELWQADQIVAGHRQGELKAELSDATEHGSRKPTDRLAPTNGSSIRFLFCWLTA